MKTIYLLRGIVTACVLFTLSACKLAVIVAEGGEVQSTGSGNCLAGEVCIIEITADNFSETFTAVADPGWRLVRWNSGGDFLCADDTASTCVLTNVGTGANPLAAAIIASDRVFYIMPVFEPIPDIVTIGAKQWYQPDLFSSLSWNAIDAVCPGGTCTNGGTLNGQDMTGWTWESVDGLNSMLNSFIGSGVLQGPSTYQEVDSGWAPEILANFRATSGNESLWGWTSSLAVDNDGLTGQIFNSSAGNTDSATTLIDLNPATFSSTIGAWFSRPAP